MSTIFLSCKLISGLSRTRVKVNYCIQKNTTIQLMQSFEVNIRICQPENSNNHRGGAEVNITFEG